MAEDNIYKFPSPKTNINELFDSLIEEGADAAIAVGFTNEEAPFFGITGLGNPYEILGLLDMAKDTVREMIIEGYFDE